MSLRPWRILWMTWKVKSHLHGGIVRQGLRAFGLAWWWRRSWIWSRNGSSTLLGTSISPTKRGTFKDDFPSGGICCFFWRVDYGELFTSFLEVHFACGIHRCNHWQATWKFWFRVKNLSQFPTSRILKKSNHNKQIKLCFSKTSNCSYLCFFMTCHDFCWHIFLCVFTLAHWKPPLKWTARCCPDLDALCRDDPVERLAQDRLSKHFFTNKLGREVG